MPFNPIDIYIPDYAGHTDHWRNKEKKNYNKLLMILSRIKQIFMEKQNNSNILIKPNLRIITHSARLVLKVLSVL